MRREAKHLSRKRKGSGSHHGAARREQRYLEEMARLFGQMRPTQREMILHMATKMAKR